MVIARTNYQEQKPDNPFVEGSPAAQEYDSVSDALIDKLSTKFELTPPRDQFRESLWLAVANHHIGKMEEDRPQKKIVRRQFETLKKASERMISALEKLHHDFREDLQGWLEEPEILKFIEQNPDSDLDEDPELETIGMEDFLSHISEIRRWSQHELLKLEQAPFKQQQISGSNLDQTIIRLAMVFEKFGDRRAKSSCYYDGASNSYKGTFFEFALVVLDTCAPDSYFSQGALGKRITRSLKDIEVKNLS